MKYIITEDQYNSLIIKRRLDQVRDLVKNQFIYQHPCDAPDFGTFLYLITREVKDNNYDFIDDENFEYVEEFINTHMKEELRDYYVYNCRDFN